jgi:hypothetical protein
MYTTVQVRSEFGKFAYTAMLEVTLDMLCDCVRLLVFQQHLCEK